MAVGLGLFGFSLLLLSQQAASAGERRLTPSELLDCYHKMDTSLGIYYNSGSGAGVLPPLRLKDIEQQEQQNTPGALTEVLKPSTCAVLNGFLAELTSTQNITVGIDETYGRLPAVQRHVRRMLRFAALEGDVDPNFDEFKKNGNQGVPGGGERLGGGYEGWTSGVAGSAISNDTDGICKRFTPDACGASNTGVVYITWSFANALKLVGSLSNNYIPVAIANRILFVTDPIKNALDFTQLYLTTGKRNQMVRNARRAIGNQIRLGAKSDAILAGVDGLSAQSTGIERRVKQASSRIATRLQQIQARLSAISAQLLVEVNTALAAVTTTITTTYARVVSKIRNVEVRVTNNITNLVLDKFSINGTSRPNRLTIPDPVLRRKLQEAAVEDTVNFGDERRGLQVTDEYFHYGYGCDGNDNDNNGKVDECEEDKFGPVIDTDAFVQATQDIWFSSTPSLFSAATGMVVGADDCGDVRFAAPVLTGACKRAQVAFSATDRCGNLASAVAPVWFDRLPPTVSFSLQPELSVVETTNPLVLKASGGLANIGVTNISVADNCDATPFVQVNIYSDEKDFAIRPPQVILTRRFDGNGALNGWKIQVAASSVSNCDGSNTGCDLADGRYYTVVLCANDQAGLRTCASQSIGVSRGNIKTPPLSQGNLFLVGHDAGYFNSVPIDKVTPSTNPSTLSMIS